MRITTPIALALALCVVAIVPPPPAMSAPTLDQNYLLTARQINSDVLVNASFPYEAQTVTPGLSGGLTKAVLQFNRSSAYTGNWEVTVRPVNGSGAPTSTILATQTITAADVPVAPATPPSVTVNFSSPAILTAGTPFALVLHPAVPSDSPSNGDWQGTFSGSLHYNGGDMWSSTDGTNFSLIGPGGVDGGFQTYVDPAITPEPTTLALFLLAPMFMRRKGARASLISVR